MKKTLSNAMFLTLSGSAAAVFFSKLRGNLSYIKLRVVLGTCILLAKIFIMEKIK